MAKKRPEVRAGIVVLAGLFILAGGLFLVSGGAETFISKVSYRVYFPNGGGISAGDAVFLAGRRVGKVTEVDTADEIMDGVARRFVAVTVEIREGSVVHTDSRVFVTKTITGVSTLHIEYGKSGEVVKPGGRLFGEKLNTFEEAIDRGSKLLADAQQAVQSFDRVVNEIGAQVGALEVKRLAAKAAKFLDTLQATADEARGLMADARPQVQSVLRSADDAAREGAGLLRDVRGGWEQLEPELVATAKNARGASADAAAIVKENREAIKLFVQNLEDASRRVAPALAQLEELGKELQGTVVEVRPNLAGAMRNARQAFTNFEALTEDLKTAPWKLINKPSSREAKAVLLFNAARLYVANAQRIQAAVDDLDALRRLELLGEEVSQEAVKKTLERLEKSLAEFEKNESDLRALMDESAK